MNVKTIALRLERKLPFKFVLVFFAAFIVVWSLLPIAWMFVTSFKTENEIYSWPPAWLVKDPTWTNYKNAFIERPFLAYVKNSVIVSFFSVLISCSLAVMAAYGFSKYKFRSGTFLFFLILASRAIPPASLLFPFYMMGRTLHLINTHTILILAYIYITLPLNIWIIKGFFDNFPEELLDAAEVDGCSRLRALGKVVLPILMPAIVAIIIITFITAWNELLYAVVFTNTPDAKTIPTGLIDFFGDFQILWGPLEAAASLSTVPAIIFSFLFARQIVSGLVAGAVKG
ncbi:MAG: carbohydrate ABC transporter permease [Firmicutes bacterium]|nr:carbohydrate ABC transporter permease [Bacillota bacterium]